MILNNEQSLDSPHQILFYATKFTMTKMAQNKEISPGRYNMSS